MKITKKRVLTTLTAASVVASMGVAFANEQSTQKLFLNGKLVEGVAPIIEGEKSYLPLRAICEGLGFTVEWKNDTRTIEIVNLPVYITCSPDYDGYTFSKTAPMKLGTAPKLIDDTTYVPDNFVEEILQGSLEVENGEYYISYGEENRVSGTVCQLVYEDDKLVQIIIGDKDDKKSQTALNLTEELAKIAIDSGIAIGSIIEAEVTGEATMSIPPQKIPTSLNVINAEEKTVEIEGTVCELIYEDEKLVQIVIGDKEDVLTQTALNLNEELAKKVLELEIAEGTKITAKTTELQTMSIPPQRIPVSIEIAK